MPKAAYTARELSEMKMIGWPQTESAMIRRADRETWPHREREGRGGGREFPFLTLPVEIRATIIEAEGALKAETIELPKEASGEDKRLTARLIILKQIDHYHLEKGGSLAAAVSEFILAYNATRLATLPAWLYEVYAEISERTVWRWRKNRKNADFDKLSKSQNNRTGTGFLDKAEGGAVAKYVVAMILNQPHLTSNHIRELCRQQFPALSMPDARLFRRWIANWKDENHVLVEKVTNPDGFRNRFLPSLGGAADDVDRPNQRWQIDASPADALCIDGRYSIYALVDVWTRRAMFHVSRTASTQGSLDLLRKAMLAWGVPEEIKTDNGSDFTSQRFEMALVQLGVPHTLCAPFQPQGKGHVERVIGTLQHDCMPLLPGFIGHSVADRKKIEARRSFAERLGEGHEKVFSVELTAEQLQKEIDLWANDVYGKRPHSALGMSPLAKYATWPHAARSVNERALDVLLAPLADGDGLRIVGKKGIRVEKAHFWSEELALHIGDTVLVRLDPDMGRIVVFDQDSRFICEAFNYERTGANRAEMAAKAKAIFNQEMTRLKKEATKDARAAADIGRLSEAYRAGTMMENNAVAAFPQRYEDYTTPAIEEAVRAADQSNTTPLPLMTREVAKRQEGTVIELSDKDRWWNRAQELIGCVEAGEMLSEDDAVWLDYAKTCAWFTTRQRFEEVKTSVNDG